MKDALTLEIENLFKECQLRGKAIEERRYPEGRKKSGNMKAINDIRR